MAIITKRHLISPRLAHWHGIKKKKQTKVVDALPYHHHPPGTHKNSAPISTIHPSTVPEIILDHLDSIYIVPILTIFPFSSSFFTHTFSSTSFASVPCIHNLSHPHSHTSSTSSLPSHPTLDLTTPPNNQYHIDFLTRSQLKV